MNGPVLAQMAGGGGPSPIGPFVVMGVIFAIFYFLAIRPQQQKERDKAKLREGLKRGDEVVTSSGMHGRVADVKGPLIWLEVAPNVKIKMERQAVDVVPARTPKTEETKAS